MWLLLLPLPWLLLGLLAAGFRRPGRPGCLFVGGLFIWPQSALLQAVGVSPALAWVVALVLMIAFPVLGYVLGLRLFPPRGGAGPEAT